MSQQSRAATAESGGGGDASRSAELTLLYAIIDGSPARIMVFDHEHRCQYVNREFLEFVGRPLHETLGRHLSEVIGPDNSSRYEAMASRIDAGENPRWEGWVDYPQQGRRYVQARLIRFSPGAGPVQRILALERDLTALKNREQELAEKLEALTASEAMNSAIVASSLDGVIVIDEDSRVIEFNPAAERTFGLTRGFVLGKPIGELIIPPALRARHAAGFNRYLATGRGSVLGRRIEVEGLRADGSTFPLELAITEVRFSGRRSFTAHLRDLTETKKAAAEIETQRARIHQIEKLSAMGSLLAGVAHELNNPLAILVAQATLLKEKADKEDIRRRAERIHAAAERSGRIVKSFLAMARQKAPNREQVNLNEIVEAALEVTAYGRRSGGIEVSASLAPDLPSIVGDCDLLGQVAANLLLNAQQALVDRGNPHIWVSTSSDADGVTLTVADNGPGVPPDIAARIFEPYFTTKAVGAGTGLGLSISRTVVENHGGRIAVVPRPGRGAVFRVSLPAGSAKAASRIREPDSRGAYAILVVDDELDVAQSLAEMLQDLGHQPSVAESVTDALKLIDQRAFDLAFVDLRMPRVSGTELRRQIGQRDAGLAARTIILTGDTVTGRDAIERHSDYSDIVVLEKPFSTEDVVAAIQRAESSPRQPR
jgi:PAS domain S-box-containing protein